MTTAQQAADSAGQRDLSTAELQQRARQFVLEYIARHGKEPTGEQVGNAHGMSERWGRNQIAAARGTRAGTAPAQQTGTARGTVAEEVAARAAARNGTASGTAGPATAVIGQGGPTPAAARPPAPPARSGAPSGTAPARPSGTAARHSGTTGTRAARPGRLAAWMESGQLIAWLGFGFGSVVSILGNVVGSWIPPKGWDAPVSPEGVPATWEPSIAAQFGAAVWPVMLLLAVEIMSRVRWGPGWQWSAVRFGGVGAVGLGSAIISFSHLNHLLTEWGYDEAGAFMGPIVVDGLMVISGFALLSISQANQRGRSS